MIDNIGKPASGTSCFSQGDKNSPITLSNVFLTATGTGYAGGGASHPQVRSVTARDKGKAYFEVTLTTRSNTSGENFGFGIASMSGHDISTTAYLGGNTAGVALYPSASGNVYFNNATTSLGATLQGNQAATFGISVDFDRKKIWWKNITAAGGWNGDVIGNQNPETSLGGFSIATLIGSPFGICIELDTASDAITLNVGGSAYAGTKPIGYDNW